MAAILKALQKTETEEKEKLVSILREAGEKHAGEVLLVRYELGQTFTLQKGYISDEDKLRVRGQTGSPVDEKVFPLGMYKVTYEGFAKILSSDELRKVAEKLARLGF
jgi:hypothetical protein